MSGKVIDFPNKPDMVRPNSWTSHYVIEECEFDQACVLFHVIMRVNELGQEAYHSRSQVAVHLTREAAESHKLDLEAIKFGAERELRRKREEKERIAKLEREPSEQAPDDGPEAA